MDKEMSDLYVATVVYLEDWAQDRKTDQNL